MLFVRNPTGVSHSPAESATDADCVAGVTALAKVLEELTEMTRWLAEYAWLPEQAEPTPDVLIETAEGRISAVTPLTPSGRPDAGVDVLADAVRLPGLTLPGLANAHSHAFHRALRGRTHGGRGDFWSWREQMYAVTDRLDPDSYLALARAVYAEMALAGITCVGEFHYLHHGPGGTPYDDPNAMSAALVEAAAHAGIRLTLLDTCYLTASVDGQPLAGPQRRFGDGDALRWADRVAAFTPDGAHARLGAAIHSVRAVPAEQLATVAGWADRRDAPLHVHLSEQPAENDACRAVHGRTPTGLLADHGVLGRSTTAVHATHPTSADLNLLGESRTGVCLCPTTERDLADGIGPARRMADAGSPAQPGQRQPRRDRPVRGGPRGRVGRAAADPAAGPLHPGRAADGGERGRARRAGLGRRRSDRGR